MARLIEVERSDLQKIADAVEAAVRHHVSRDEMNAALHLAHTLRLSPLTSELMAASDRIEILLAEDR